MVYSAGELYRAELVKDLLENAGIPCVILNKKDSSVIIGEAEVYVKRDDVLQALKLIKKTFDA
ncbi:MAG: hypothetical protein KatS3mg031_2547 [Chitinophagales bacterium]|nr:MAG: hypothetical protein KatS3mg031_2547 [Chitinophagales bacterium]